MSRIGKKPIIVTNDVKVNIEGNKITIKGPKGELSYSFNPRIKVSYNENNKAIVVERENDEKTSKMLHGLTRALIANMVLGVKEGFSKKLVITGVGYNAKAQGNELLLNLGYSHPIKYKIPEGIAIETPTPTEIVVKGINKEKVGQVAAIIRKFREPEPYKGKGIKYSEEVILRKAGKSGSK